MQIKKILVPTDFSPEAKNALDVAAQLAKRVQATITLFHALDIPYAGGSSVSDGISIVGTSTDHGIENEMGLFIGKLMEITRSKIQEEKDRHPDVNIVEHVVFDDMARSLDSIVSEQEADFIVMGTHGQDGMEEMFLNSNAERVIRTAKVPVLTLKLFNKHADFKRIAFASNFVNVPQKAIQKFKQIQHLLGAHTDFVKIITPNTFETTLETNNTINKFIRENNFENCTAHAFNYYTEEEGIRAFAETHRCDLIAMTTHGRTGLSHLLFGSIAEDVANHSLLPVLTYNLHVK
jgi:nucleotide-binding universal stress UspA family protein